MKFSNKLLGGGGAKKKMSANCKWKGYGRKSILEEDMEERGLGLCEPCGLPTDTIIRS